MNTLAAVSLRETPWRALLACLLVKGEGYQAEAVNSSADILDAAEVRDFVMGLNYTHLPTAMENVDINL